MEMKDIRELVKLIDKSSVTEIEIEKEEYKVRIAKNTEVQVLSQAVAPTAAQVMPSAAPAVAPSADSTSPVVEDSGNYIEVKSPMVGTYYSAP